MQLPALNLDHIGFAAPSFGESRLLALLATETPAPTEMPSGVAIARFGPARMLELVVPVRGGNPIERFLERRGAGLHHVAFATAESLEQLAARLPQFDLAPIGRVEPSSDGRPSLFLHPSSTGGVLVELVQVER